MCCNLDTMIESVVIHNAHCLSTFSIIVERLSLFGVLRVCFLLTKTFFAQLSKKALC